MKSPRRRRSPTKRINSRHPSSMLSKIDIEIDNIYHSIMELHSKQSPPNKYRDLTLTHNFAEVVKYILSKQPRYNNEIEILKTYFNTLNNFSSCIKDFKIASDDLMDKICNNMMFESCDKGIIVTKYGDINNKFYLILSGHVSEFVLSEIEVKMSYDEYLKYLLLLRVYEEFELLSQIINNNSKIFIINENAFGCLYIMITFYKQLIEHKVIIENSTNYVLITDFDKYEDEYSRFIEDHFQKDYNLSIPLVLSTLNIKETLLLDLYSFYSGLYDKVLKKNHNKLNGRSGRRNITKRTTRIYTRKHVTLSPFSVDSIYDDIVNGYNPELYFSNNEDYCKRIQHNKYGIIGNKEIRKRVIKIYQYKELKTLSEGEVFGDSALMSQCKKSACTVLALTNCSFATLTQHEFDVCLRGAREKVRYATSIFFVRNPIFKNITSASFDKKYFNYFKEREFKKGEYLLHKDSNKRGIYFIKHGEVQISFNSTVQEFQYILEQYEKSVNTVNDKEYNYQLIKLIKNLKDNYSEIGFEQFYNKTVKNFKLCSIRENEVCGLDNFIINNQYFCDCVALSQSVKTFHLGENHYNIMSNDKLVKPNLELYITLKKEILLKRMKEIFMSTLTAFERNAKLHLEIKDYSFGGNDSNNNNNKNRYINSRKTKFVINANSLIKHSSNNSTSKPHQYFSSIEKSSCTFDSIDNNNNTNSIPNNIYENTTTSFLINSHYNNHTINNHKGKFIIGIKTRPLRNQFLKDLKTMDSHTKTSSIFSTLNTKIPNLTLKTNPSKAKNRRVGSFEKSADKVKPTKVYPNNVGNSYRTRKILYVSNISFSNLRPKQVKEKQVRYYHKTNYNTTSNFFLQNQQLFSGLLESKSNSKPKEAGVIDCLFFDKWVERKSEGKKFKK